jgi:serine protease AprX
VTRWRNTLASALTASICLFGFAAAAGADSGHSGNGRQGAASKLDAKLAGRAAAGAPGISRAIVMLNPGCNAEEAYARANARRGRHLDIINADVIAVPNAALLHVAKDSCVRSLHWDRPAGGEMNYAAVVEGARAVQQAYGYDGAGVGVAVIDSGVTGWHDDLTYNGNSPKVKVVGGQRVSKFVDFVNGLTTPYDDNGHGTHVSGIIAGNGYDTSGSRAGMAPAANIVSLKVLDANASGIISNVIAALNWVVANRSTYNVRVVNLSVGAAVTESYRTDPLTLAAKAVVDQGIVVVTAAGNLGMNPITGATQYGAITAPGNAPWVLTVGAYSHQGTLSRTDDAMAPYSSHGPTAFDYGAKPDLVATGTGIASLAAPGSLLYTTKTAYLLGGSLLTATKPYLSLTGTSMASPVVAGAVALMLQANPKLTPNLVKGILQYTAQPYQYDTLTQGAGFLNAKGAVDLARYLKNPQNGSLYPSNASWGKTIIWGNRKVQRGVIKPAGSAWAQSTEWGAVRDVAGNNIVWGTACARVECDNIVWGTAEMDGDNIVWGTYAREGDNIVWGTAREGDNIVWGTACAAGECDNIVWGTECGLSDCDNIVWGTALREADNIVWGTALESDNIVWGTAGEFDNIVWGTAREGDNIVWGTSGEDGAIYADPTDPIDVNFDALFGGGDPAPAGAGATQDPPPAILTDTTVVVGGGF